MRGANSCDDWVDCIEDDVEMEVNGFINGLVELCDMCEQS